MEHALSRQNTRGGSHNLPYFTTVINTITSVLVHAAPQAYKPFKPIHHTFALWHDATPSPCPFQLTILDTLKGLYKARECRFFDFDKFNIEEYEYFEQVENGDLNWCLDDKFIAFAGPHATKEVHPGGYHTLCPDDYVQYFKKKNVQLVIRLNKKYYDAKRFTNHGINHMELYFLDGSNPPDNILVAFLRACELCPGAVAVHCKAGLGRTGSCIGSYMMKHFKFTAEEVIGWLRIVRPGSVIGPQQQFIKDTQLKMWRDGDIYRATIAAMPSTENEVTERDGRSDVIVVKKTKSMNEHKASSSSNSSSSNNNNSLTPTRGLVSGLISMSVAGPGRERSDDSFGEEGYSQGDSLRAARTLAYRATTGLSSGSSNNNSKKNSLHTQFLSSWK